MTPGEALTPALERLPGVLAATVLPGPDNRRRVYLAAAPEADHAELRETVSGLLSDHGLDCPVDRIHVGTPPPTGLSDDVLPPLHVEGLDVRRSDHQVTCEVTLRVGGRSVSGVAREPDSPTGRCRAAARATLAAAERVDPDLRLGLEGIRTLDLFGHEAITVLVEGSMGRAVGHLPGTRLMRRSPEESACRAALAALAGWSA